MIAREVKSAVKELAKNELYTMGKELLDDILRMLFQKRLKWHMFSHV